MRGFSPGGRVPTLEQFEEIERIEEDGSRLLEPQLFDSPSECELCIRPGDGTGMEHVTRDWPALYARGYGDVEKQAAAVARRLRELHPHPPRSW